MDRDMGMQLVAVAVDAAVQRANPPPPPQPENNQMQLVIYNPADMPLKKRILQLLREAEENRAEENREDHFPCNVCGRVFASRRSVAGHRAHHRVGPSQRKRPRGGAVVVNDGGEPRPCMRCERMFGSARGLGAHKRFCKARLARFDLNELPPAEEEEILRLPWLR